MSRIGLIGAAVLVISSLWEDTRDGTVTKVHPDGLANIAVLLDAEDTHLRGLNGPVLYVAMQPVQPPDSPQVLPDNPEGVEDPRFAVFAKVAGSSPDGVLKALAAVNEQVAEINKKLDTHATSLGLNANGFQELAEKHDTLHQQVQKLEQRVQNGPTDPAPAAVEQPPPVAV